MVPPGGLDDPVPWAEEWTARSRLHPPLPMPPSLPLVTAPSGSLFFFIPPLLLLHTYVYTYVSICVYMHITDASRWFPACLTGHPPPQWRWPLTLFDLLSLTTAREKSLPPPNQVIFGTMHHIQERYDFRGSGPSISPRH